MQRCNYRRKWVTSCSNLIQNQSILILLLSYFGAVLGKPVNRILLSIYLTGLRTPGYTYKNTCSRGQSLVSINYLGVLHGFTILNEISRPLAVDDC